VVKIKSRAKLSKFFAILAVAAFISLGLYLFRDSAFGVLVSRAFDRIFNTNERELVEIVNLNELNSSPSSGDETKYEEIVINESGVENYVAKTVDLSGIEIRMCPSCAVSFISLFVWNLAKDNKKDCAFVL